MTGHEIGLLKGYMQDMVEQARQESAAFQTAGYREPPYSPDQALLDLLAILDDRMESEGLQAGLTEAFRYRMGEVCRSAMRRVKEDVWLAENLSPSPTTRAEIRLRTFQALLSVIEAEDP